MNGRKQIGIELPVSHRIHPKDFEDGNLPALAGYDWLLAFSSPYSEKFVGEGPS
ncbi:MAG: hypothetical protein NPIRA06_25120 [Nitrospirales bacterium]|nr:MAG: hypothetical protein NPIRA06_25120 [Nitrospirales bacterium]